MEGGSFGSAQCKAENWNTEGSSQPFFAVLLMEHWNRLPRGDVVPPPLKYLKNYPDMHLNKQLYVSLLKWVNGPDDFQP